MRMRDTHGAPTPFRTFSRRKRYPGLLERGNRDCPQLLERAQLIRDPPVPNEPPIGHPHDVDDAESGLLVARWEEEERPSLGSVPRHTQHHLVALGHAVLDLRSQVAESTENGSEELLQTVTSRGKS